MSETDIEQTIHKYFLWFVVIYIPPYICKILRWTKSTNSVRWVQKQFIFPKTSGALRKQIAYLRSAKVGDSTDIYFNTKNIKLPKLKIFFFNFLLHFSVFWKNNLIKMKCSPTTLKCRKKQQNQVKIYEIIDKSEITAKYLWIDYSSIFYCPLLFG